MRVIKSIKVQDVERVTTFFSQLPVRNRPAGVTIDAGLAQMSYVFVVGAYPSEHLDEVLATAEDALWENEHFGSYLQIDADAYCRYVLALKCEMFLLSFDKTLIVRTIEQRAKHATPVRGFHGDMTLENCVWSPSGHVVFLDPGHHRGMPCRELDEAKIMQSVDGWDHLKHGHPLVPWNRDGDTATPLHYALLATHYMRLIPHHIEHGRLVEFADRQIRKICSTLRRWL